MKRTVAAGWVAMALALGATAPSLAQQAKPEIAHTHLKVGDLAPDFALRDQNRNVVKLSDFQGKKNVILAFYVLAFTSG
jgi:cytochrome oxidase Cu insertion factor (SCO1/SenC/PrrC family)